MHIYIYIYIHIYTCIYIYICTYIYAYIHTYVYLHSYIYVFICIFLYLCVLFQLFLDTFCSPHMCLFHFDTRSEQIGILEHTYTYVRIYIHMYIHLHCVRFASLSLILLIYTFPPFILVLAVNKLVNMNSAEGGFSSRCVCTCIRLYVSTCVCMHVCM